MAYFWYLIFHIRENIRFIRSVPQFHVSQCRRFPP